MVECCGVVFVADTLDIRGLGEIAGFEVQVKLDS